MKKLLIFFVLCFVAVNICTPNAAYAQISPTVFLNGQQIYFIDAKPVIVDGRTLIPARGVFEKMGCKVEWNGDNRTVQIQRGSIVVAMQIENPTITLGRILSDNTLVKDGFSTLEVAPRVVDGRTMIPARAIAECLGAKVDWNGQARAVMIYDESLTSGVITSAIPIQWSDFGVEMCVRDLLNKPFGTITAEECEYISYLDLYGYDVKSLYDLKWFKNLQSLYVSDAYGLDLYPISNLGSLQELNLNDCGIYDLSPLAGLYNLQYLYLNNNSIKNLEPLSSLTQIKILSAENNSIRDVSPLEGMYNLEELYLDGNPISDVSCIDDVIGGVYSLSLDFDYLQQHELNYPVSDHMAELMDYVNGHRRQHNLQTLILNDPYINNYLSGYARYWRMGDSERYLDILSNQYRANALFRRSLPMDTLEQYDSIVEWMYNENESLMEDLLWGEWHGREIFVSMHYDGGYLVVEMAEAR